MTFRPIFKDRIWGGTKLKDFLGKEIPSDTTGESWELSGVGGDVSVVASGAYSGLPLDELIRKFPDELLGRSVVARFGDQLPLLFKFIDAREDLSIQVHPNDDFARARHNSFGKTEMWYVMQSDPESRLIIGFRNESSATEYLKHLGEKTLPEILQSEPVSEGDVFFLESGTIHAIGAGILLAEIQQTSDITYRVYDWDRVDKAGNSRQLHVEEALDVMNYRKIDTSRDYLRNPNAVNSIVDSRFFTAGFISLSDELSVRRSSDSFYVYMCVGGEFSIEADEGVWSFRLGDTVLVPAALTRYKLRGKAKLLQVHIN